MKEKEQYAEYLVTAKVYDLQGNPTGKVHRIVFDTMEGPGLEERMKKSYEESFSRDCLNTVIRKVESVKQIRPGELETGMQYGF